MKQIVFAAEAVWKTQMRCLLTRGYDFGVDEKDVPLPDAEKLKLGPALLVDYETPIEEQCQLLGVKNYLDLKHHTDQYPKPQGRWGWIYRVGIGKKFTESSRRGLMTVEGLALYRENSSLLKDNYVDLCGSRCGKLDGGVPGLYLGGGVPSLDLNLNAGSCFDMDWDSASCAL